MTVPIGSLFSGAGALCELAVAPLLGGRVVWHFEFEPPSKKTPKPTQAAARVLAHRFPGTPNFGDITAIDWRAVEPVEVLAGGFPCTDVSSGGLRAGLRPGTRSGLWSHMAYAISVLRPRLVVIENVRGLAWASAYSDMEPCPWCLGDGPDQHALRALGAVLGDLADLGYDAVWCGLRASDLGACHERFRFVILAAPADAAGPRWAQLEPVDVGGHGGEAQSRITPSRAIPSRRRRAGARSRRPGSAGPTPSDLRVVDRPAVGRDDPESLQLMPTPAAADGERSSGAYGRDNPTLLGALLPTPTAMDARGSRNATSGRAKGSKHHDGTTLTDAVWELGDGVDWGIYEPAILQHERWLGRPAPHPTVRGARGGKTLNPQLSEWMMGWPAGWVTDVPGITPNDAKQMCGNGVVPQQMVAGIRYLLPLLAEGRWAA